MKKKFLYRGKSIEELESTTLEDLTELLPARQRRALKRGMTKQQKKKQMKYKIIFKSKHQKKLFLKQMILVKNLQFKKKFLIERQLWKKSGIQSELDLPEIIL